LGSKAGRKSFCQKAKAEKKISSQKQADRRKGENGGQQKGGELAKGMAGWGLGGGGGRTVKKKVEVGKKSTKRHCSSEERQRPEE